MERPAVIKRICTPVTPAGSCAASLPRTRTHLAPRRCHLLLQLAAQPARLLLQPRLRGRRLQCTCGVHGFESQSADALQCFFSCQVYQPNPAGNEQSMQLLSTPSLR